MAQMIPLLQCDSFLQTNDFIHSSGCEPNYIIVYK